MQVQIRQLGGGDVSLEDCARFSTPLGEAIESSQLAPENYVLEVSSPGISDKLLSDRDFKTFKGFPIEVTYSSEKNSQLSKRGLLHEKSQNHLHLNIKGRMSRINLDAITEVRLVSPTG